MPCCAGGLAGDLAPEPAGQQQIARHVAQEVCVLRVGHAGAVLLILPATTSESASWKECSVR